ncbi:MAG: hypothetical protein AB7O62_24595 [Pirellulales bacterium]
MTGSMILGLEKSVRGTLLGVCTLLAMAVGWPSSAGYAADAPIEDAGVLM